METKPKPLEQKIKMSQVNNTTGYFRVSKRKANQYKQGFIWQYAYIDDNGKSKKISSVDLKKLEKKVVSKGLIWIKFDEE